jgi:hypothetical protein
MKRAGIFKTTVWGLVILIASAGACLADTLYVSSGQSIQAAIDAANNGDQIEVAPGTYNEAVNFNGKAIRLYSSAGPAVTTINANGAAHAVQCVNGENDGTILEGFTITGGIANGISPDNRGGGMLNVNSSPTVINCTFSANSATYGGGMYNETGSNPTVTNCTFNANSANYGSGMWNNGDCSSIVTNCIFSSNNAGNAGGGMFNGPGSTTVTANCIFINNTAGYGAGIWNYTSSPMIINSAFSNNNGSNGGGMYNEAGSNITLYNCTFSGNTSNGILNSNSSSVVTNCILWNNTPSQIYNNPSSSATVTYSDVDGGFAGTGNIDTDPCFIDAAVVNLRLRPGSPCIDAGNNALVPAGVLLDADGRPRFRDDPYTADTGIGPASIVDIGAFEYGLTDKFGYVNAKNVKLTLADCNSNNVTFAITGGGYGLLDPCDCTFDQIVLFDTTEKSKLTISTKSKDGSCVGSIICSGPLGGITAKGIDIRGIIQIGAPAIPNPKAELMMTFDQADDLVINSQIPIKMLSATEWKVGSINAPAIGSITIKGDKKRGLAGDFGASMTIGKGDGSNPVEPVLKSLKIAGTLGGDSVINGSVGTANIKILKGRLEVKGDAKSVKVSHNLITMSYLEDTGGELDVDGKASIIAGKDKIKVQKGADLFSSQDANLYCLEDLRRYNEPGAWWTYHAEGSANAFGDKETFDCDITNSISTGNISGHDCNIILTSGDGIDISTGWYTDGNETHMATWGNEEFDLKMDVTMVAQKYLQLGREYNGTGTFGGEFDIDDIECITVSGSVSGSVSTTVKLLGHEEVTVPAGTFLAAKVEMTMLLKGAMDILFEEDCYYYESFDTTGSFNASMKQTWWGVPGVGIVKAITKPATIKISAKGAGSASMSATEVDELISNGP